MAILAFQKPDKVLMLEAVYGYILMYLGQNKNPQKYLIQKKRI